MDNKQKRKRKPNQKSSFSPKRGGPIAGIALIAALLSLFQRVFLTNIIGDTGNAYFSIAYDTFTFFLILFGGGMGAAVTRMVASRAGRGQYRNAGKVWNCSVLFAAAGGVTAGAILFFLSDFLADKLYAEPMAALAMKALAPSLLVLPMAGVFRGYYEGLGTKVPTVLSRVLEQVVLLAVMLPVAKALGAYGGKVGALLQNNNYEYSFGAAGGSLGFLAGGLATLLFLGLIYLMLRGNIRKWERKEMAKGTEGFGRVAQILLVTAAPVILLGLIENGAVFLDQLIFLKTMAKEGAGRISSWGIYTGKTRVLAAFPMAVCTAFVSAVVPALEVAGASYNAARFKEKCQISLRCVMLLAFPMAASMAVLAGTVVPAFYSKGDIETAVRLLRLSCIAIAFGGPAVMLSGILKSSGRLKLAGINGLIALVLHAVALVVMLTKFDLKIDGVVFANIVLAVLLFLLNFAVVQKTLSLRIDWIRSFAVPAIASGVMAGICYFINKSLAEKLGNVATLLLSLLIGTAVYFVLILFFRCITERELKSVPGGAPLAAAARALHLM